MTIQTNLGQISGDTNWWSADNPIAVDQNYLYTASSVYDVNNGFYYDFGFTVTHTETVSLSPSVTYGNNISVPLLFTALATTNSALGQTLGWTRDTANSTGFYSTGGSTATLLPGSYVLSFHPDNSAQGQNLSFQIGVNIPSTPPPPALFTAGADTVNFNSLMPAQVAAITAGADLYHSLGGADQVWLPANGTALAPGITWDSSKVFSIGSPSSVVPPGDDGATIHSGPSNDLIDGASETNAQFGGAANQRGNVVFTNGDTVEFSGSFPNYTIKELTGGYLEIKDNRGIDGTDILKDIAFLKFDGDGTNIPAPGRELQTVSDSSAAAWLQSQHVPSAERALAVQMIHAVNNARWAANPASASSASPQYTITWSYVSDLSKLPADYVWPGVTNLEPFTAAGDANMAIADISKIFAEIHSFLPNVTFKEVNENSAADARASALGLGDVGTIRFVGFGDTTSDPVLGQAVPPGFMTNFGSQLGDIVLSRSSLGGARAFHPGHQGYEVLEHEIGHALGLGHVITKLPTIMDTGQFPPVKNYSHLDKLALQALYDAPGTGVFASLGSTASSGDAFVNLRGRRADGGTLLDDSHTTTNVTVTAPSALSNLAASSSLLVQAMASFGTDSSLIHSPISAPLSDSTAQSFLAPNSHQHG
jgi:hypothetical protein